MRDSRYDILFEPIKIGPVIAKNRFYQVPHCTGLGWLRPRMVAALRAMKAEGGWGVVCTEYCSIHPSSDDLPHPYASLWDEGDIKAHALMTEQVHAHDALAGVELWYGGQRSGNLFTNEMARDVSCRPNSAGIPFQTRAMDKADIRELRRWHRNAALRAKEAEFDIVYVYATHGYLLSHFLSRHTNTRSDEYGGCLENRVRLVRELIEETKEAVGDRCAVAVRFSADEGSDDANPAVGEQRDMLALLAELPDIWDINIHDYSREMGVSRFVKEASLESTIAYVKAVTSKPVVSVGRFTSPDTMLSQIKRGVIDFIGAARPSIADPFLPQKIEQGRLEELRECIGCNICYVGDSIGTPLRCTQNPTIGEEWRRGWHPEKMPSKRSEATVLVIGAGPAGLEATRALGLRGYQVLLAEAEQELGGRINREAQLPGLSEWVRVRDYRKQQIQRMANVDIYCDNRLSAEDVLDLEADHIVIATGATWRADGVGRFNETTPVQFGPSEQIFTPDDIMLGRLPEGPTIIFDDDYYYMASVIAERLRAESLPVTLVTSANTVSAWGARTSEQSRNYKRLFELGVAMVSAHGVSAYDGSQAELCCVHTGQLQTVQAQAVVTVTARTPNDALYWDLAQRINVNAKGANAKGANTSSLARIGDCEAPAIIASAVFAGHRYARELDTVGDPDQRIKYDRVF